MSDPIKISALTAGSAAAGTEKIPVVQSGVTVRLTPSQLTSGLDVATTGAKGLMSAADKTALATATSSATPDTFMARDSSGNVAVAELSANRVYVSAAPATALEAANKQYVDGAVTGLHVLAPCLVATTGNVSLVGGAPSTVDGVVQTVGNRILVRSQSTTTQNGIYTVSVVGSGSNGTWIRSTDADTGAELITGSYVFVTAGTTLSSTGWTMTTTGTITLGSSSIVWTLFSQVVSVNTSSLIGTIVANQIADAAITVAKFASGLRPVEIVATLPVSDLTEGRLVYLTTDDKLYRYTGSAWTAAIAAVDITGTLTNSQIADLAAAKLTGQITTTQITDSSITTAKVNAGAITTAKIAALAVTASEIAADAITAAKIFAGSVTTSKLAAGAVTANELAANSVISGKIIAGAVSTSELAAGAVNASKIAASTITTNEIAANTILAGNIAAGTITGNKISAATITGSLIAAGTITASHLTVSSLSAIVADLGSITAGSIDIGTSLQQIQISNGHFKQGCFTLDSDNGVGTTTLLHIGLGGSIKSIAYNSVVPIKLSFYNALFVEKAYISSEGGGSFASLAVAGTSTFTGTLTGASIKTTALEAVTPGTSTINLDTANGLQIACGRTPTAGAFVGYLTMKASDGQVLNIPFYGA